MTNAPIVIASEAKQSRATAAAQRSLDCFVASLLAMTVECDRKPRFWGRHY
jgi:hypothetical protein